LKVEEIYRTSLLVPYIELIYTGGIALNKDHLADKLLLNSRVMRFAPAPAVTYQQVVLLALNNEVEQALLQLERAAAAYPGGLENFVRVARGMPPKNRAALEPLLKLAEQKLREQRGAVRTE
ncbi:MAG: Wzy polymerase domain-containing protein, partial [Burkholderiales bacterium]